MARAVVANGLALPATAKELQHRDQSNQGRRRYELVPVAELLSLRQEPQFIVEGLVETNVAAGIIGPPESGKSLLAMNIAACVATGQPFHGRATRRGLVVYLLGEGQQGAARRFQALEQRHQLGLARAPLVVSKCRTSLIEVAELARVRDAIAEAESDFGEKMTLLVVDTLARFIAPGDDSSSQDMGAFIDAVDQLRGEASSITLHHPGHGEGQKRGRGSSSLRGGLDAEFFVSNTDQVITVTCEKMKDGEKPAPFSFQIEQAPTMSTGPDGFAVMSVLLAPTDVAPTMKTAKGQELRGRAQLQLLKALRAQNEAGRIWTLGDIREVGRKAGMSKSTAHSATEALSCTTYLVPTVGGWRFGDG